MNRVVPEGSMPMAAQRAASLGASSAISGPGRFESEYQRGCLSYGQAEAPFGRRRRD